LVVRQERTEQFVVGAERVPSSERRVGKEGIACPINPFLMRFWSEGVPTSKRARDLEAVFIPHLGWPPGWEICVQLAHALRTHQASDLMVSLSFSYESAEHLHACDVVPSKLLGQLDQ